MTHKLHSWNSGGGIELDVIEIEDGPTLVVSDETVAIYRSVDDFWAETEDGDEGHRTVTVLRETGQPLELVAAR